MEGEAGESGINSRAGARCIGSIGGGSGYDGRRHPGGESFIRSEDGGADGMPGAIRKNWCTRRRTEQNRIDTKAKCIEHLNAMKAWVSDTEAELKVSSILY